VAIPRQVDIILYLIRSVMYGEFVGLACDNILLVQALQEVDLENSEIYMWAATSGTTKTMIKEVGGEREVTIRNKEYYVSLLKQYMLAARAGLFSTRLWLCDDTEMMNELAGTTERRTDSGYTVYYGPTDPTGVGLDRQLDHIRDALSFLVLAISVSGRGTDSASEDELFAVMGWVGGPGWTPVQRPSDD